MVYIINQAIQTLQKVAMAQDARAPALPLTTLNSMIAVTAVYLSVLSIGPKLMEKRNAFVLRGSILLYNVAQICLNGFLLTHSVYELAMHPAPYYFSCTAPTTADPYYSDLEFSSVYAYHLLKVLDLLDTVFFVLRKKSAQVTFLHVYHHLAVMWGTGLVVNFSPGGHFVFLGLCNMFVHTLMYGYYFASVYQPEVKKSLAIKKLVTLTQMVQFVMLIIHSGGPLVLSSPCETPIFLLALSSIQNIFMLLMFSDFYIRNYIVRPQRDTPNKNT